jgi:hypothetical protein
MTNLTAGAAINQAERDRRASPGAWWHKKTTAEVQWKKFKCQNPNVK